MSSVEDSQIENKDVCLQEEKEDKKIKDSIMVFLDSAGQQYWPDGF